MSMIWRSGARLSMTDLHTPTNSSEWPESDRNETKRRVRVTLSQSRLSGLRVPRLQIGVDVDVAHPERAPDANRRQVPRLDQAVDRHGGHPHQLGDFLHCQEARFGERLRHGPHPLAPARWDSERRWAVPLLSSVSRARRCPSLWTTGRPGTQRSGRPISSERRVAACTASRKAARTP